jgi:hypothetical protein
MSEEFVRVMTDVLPLVDAGTIYEPERKEVKEAIDSILIDGLMPAFSELRQIREMQGKAAPVMNRSNPMKTWPENSGIRIQNSLHTRRD